MTTQKTDANGSIDPDAGASRPSRWRRFVAVAVVASSTMLVVDVAPAAAGTCSGSVEAAAESRFVSKLNSLRQSRGLRTLAVNTGITGPSREWSAYMSATNKLQHDPNYVAKIAKAVPDWTRAAENVGQGGLSSCSNANAVVDSLHKAFVNSSGHFKNMIGDFNQVGIGVHTDASRLWVTVRFAKGTIPVTYTAQQLQTAATYIDDVYRLFLDRGSSSGENSFWAGTVIDGKRMKLTSALSVSDEWAGVRIDDLYQSILGRSSDPLGRETWLAAIRKGKRLEDVAASFYGSKEYFIKAGATNKKYVQSLYSQILGRNADAAGLDFWTGTIQRGKSRKWVAAEFYASVESRTDRVTKLYWEILGRGPDSTGLAHWSYQLKSFGDIKLAATLASSYEYWKRSTS